MKEFQYYKTFLYNYRKTGKVFTDHYFHPRKNIHETKTNLDRNQIEWRRIDEFYKAPLFDEKLISIQYVEQGKLGDCYFMSAICRIAKQPELVSNLFDKTANTVLGITKNSINIKCGAVVIYFHAFGRKTPVLIDTLIPFHKGTSNPIFSRPTNHHVSPWFCLVEKAYAKLNGSYSNICSGHFYNAIYSLFGYLPQSKKISDLFKEEKTSKKTPFQRILGYQRQGGVMDAAIDSGISRISHHEIQKVGLVSNHSYLLDKLVEYKKMHFYRIRNPWGRTDWCGDWSDKSPLWTKEMKEALHFHKSEDGTFWMIEKDFFRYFTTIDISRPIPQDWHSRTFSIEMWPGRGDGYHPESSKVRMGRRPNYALKINQKVPDNEKVPLVFLFERRSYLPDKVATVNLKPSPFIVLFVNSKGQKLTQTVLRKSSRFYLTVSSSIFGYKYVLNKGEILTIAIQRIQKMNIYEECSIQVSCKYDFDLYDIDFPKELVPENQKQGSLFKNFLRSQYRSPLRSQRPHKKKHHHHHHWPKARKERQKRGTNQEAPEIMRIKKRGADDDDDDDDYYEYNSADYSYSSSDDDDDDDDNDELSEDVRNKYDDLLRLRNEIQNQVNDLIDQELCLQNDVNELMAEIETEKNDQKIVSMTDEISLKRAQLESLEQHINDTINKMDQHNIEIEKIKSKIKKYANKKADNEERNILSTQTTNEDRNIPSKQTTNKDRNIPSRQTTNEDRNIPSRQTTNEDRNIPSRQTTNKDRNIPSRQKSYEDNRIPSRQTNEDRRTQSIQTTNEDRKTNHKIEQYDDKSVQAANGNNYKILKTKTQKNKRAKSTLRSFKPKITPS